MKRPDFTLHSTAPDSSLGDEFNHVYARIAVLEKYVSVLLTTQVRSVNAFLAAARSANVLSQDYKSNSMSVTPGATDASEIH